jgi:hypothetical protein
MTKKSLIFIAILILLVLGIFQFSRAKNEPTSTSKEEIDFSYQEVDKLSRIFFANKSGKYIDLKKLEDGKWMLNNKYTAWQKKVDFLLYETFKKVRVKGAAPKPAVDNIIKRMAITGIKVELYSSDTSTPDQVYYIGGTTPDQLGTYFWAEGSTTPYVTYVPGFTGYLNSRFDLQPRNWISRTIFAYDKSDIQSIGVSYKNQACNIVQSNDQIILKDSNGNTLAANPDALSSYIAFFKKLNMEAIIDLTDNQKDSIQNTKPMAKITVTNKTAQAKTLNIYYKPSHDKMHNLHTVDGERLTFDPNRYYAIIEGNKDWMIIQDYTFAKVLRTADEFNSNFK